MKKNLFVLFIVCIIFSCKKSDNLKETFPDASKLTQLLNWIKYDEEGKKIGNLRFKDGNSVNAVKIDPKKAIYTYSPGYTYIEIPVYNGVKTISNDTTINKVSLVFQFDKNGRMLARIKQYIYLNNNNSSEGRNAAFVYQDLNGKAISAYQSTLSLGRFVPAKIMKIEQFPNKTLNRKASNNKINAVSCIDNYIPVFDLRVYVEPTPEDPNHTIAVYEVVGYTIQSNCYDTEGYSHSYDVEGFNYNGNMGSTNSNGTGEALTNHDGLQVNPPCPSTFKFRNDVRAMMVTDVWGVHYAVHDPYSNELVTSHTFGLSIFMPNDLIYIPTASPSDPPIPVTSQIPIIKGYVGAHLLNPADLVTVTAGGKTHLIISPKVLALIATRAYYETSVDIKDEGMIFDIAVPGGKSRLTNKFKSWMESELKSILPGCRVQALWNKPGTANNVIFPTGGPFSTCP